MVKTTNSEYFKLHSQIKEKGKKTDVEATTKIRKSRAAKKFAIPLWARRMEMERQYIEKVRAFKPIPIRDDEFYEAIRQYSSCMSFSEDADLMNYVNRRWKEFCVYAIITLRDVLTVGKGKSGRLDLGKMNYAVVDRIFSNLSCIKEMKEDTMEIGYDKVVVKYYKYHFVAECGFPSLDTTNEWWRASFFPDQTCPDMPLQESKFTHLTFTTNDRDNTVSCCWDMETYTMVINNYGEDHRLGEGFWSLTV